MNEVVIKFPSKEHAEVFMSWLDGQGEQDYWVWAEENPPEVSSFKYDYENQTIVGKE